jgi:hypothetical protein
MCTLLTLPMFIFLSNHILGDFKNGKHKGVYFYEISSHRFRSSVRASNNEKSTRKDKITYADTVGSVQSEQKDSFNHSL